MAASMLSPPPPVLSSFLSPDSFWYVWEGKEKVDLSNLGIVSRSMTAPLP